MEKLDINTLLELESKHLIYKQKHPQLSLFIWNYTPEVQYGDLWNVNPLIARCRGLVTDTNGLVICHCIPKFFNYEQLNPDQIPNEEYEISKKMDGSYISMFNYTNEWIFASRGSFTSDQAILAKKIFNEKYSNIELNQNINYIMELIGPDNRIVCEYENNDLILLTAFETVFGHELSIYNNTYYVNTFNGFHRVLRYQSTGDFNYLKSIISDEEEGFVIRFKLSGKRMKIKGEKYIELHRIITNISNKTIWECLSKNENMDKIIELLPDEYYNWFNNVVAEIKAEYKHVEDTTLDWFKYIMTSYNNPDKKIFAREALKSPFNAILFKLYDNKPYEYIIWKMIKPELEKPFRDGFPPDELM